MSIGKKIKELRKSQDVTQEKLAAYLNISYQAISKWENGTAYPDITLVPKIANFFAVTTDELLGMKQSEKTIELQEYERLFAENERLGKTYQNIELGRAVLEKYPRNYQWMLNLAHSLVFYNDSALKENRDYTREAIALCERIREDCTDDSIRHGAAQILCYNYPKIGKKYAAIQLAMEMPQMVVSQELLLEQRNCGVE